MLNYKQKPLRKEHEILFFGDNILGKDYIVGDIHGQFHKLEKLLNNVGFDSSTDRLFSAGDLVDRGEYSKDVINWLRKDWFFPVMGNHDEFVLWQYYKQPGFDEKRWASEMNGGQWWFNLSFKEQTFIAEFLRLLPHAIEIQKKDKTIGIVHADVPELCNNDWSVFKDAIQHRDNEIMHQCKINRNRARHAQNPIIQHVDDVYFGHCAFPEPLHKGNCHYIDTGASYEDYPPESPYYREWGTLTLTTI